MKSPLRAEIEIKDQYHVALLSFNRRYGSYNDVIETAIFD